MAPNAHRNLFISAAWFNFLTGLPLLVATATFGGLLGLQINPTALVFIHIIAAVIVVFGGAYWMIARDPVRFRPYIALGIILKVVLVVIICAHWFAGSIPWPLPALAAADVIFAVLFWRYYSATRI